MAVTGTSLDLAAMKEKQRAGWASGDVAVTGTPTVIVSELLCEALDLRSGSRVLDVAAGNGNATLAAARRWCDVTSTDYVPQLLEHGRQRAAAEGHDNITFHVADAESLPFAEGEFDVVLSTFGAMFTPDQDKAARELLRVCKPGGRMGLTNWTPTGFAGRMFKLAAQYTTLAAGSLSPAAWGTRERLAELFSVRVAEIRVQEKQFVFRYRSPSHWLDVYRVYYGPMHTVFASLDTQQHAALTRDLLRLIEECNRSGDNTLVLPCDYLEVVIVKSA